MVIVLQYEQCAKTNTFGVLHITGVSGVVIGVSVGVGLLFVVFIIVGFCARLIRNTKQKKRFQQ